MQVNKGIYEWDSEKEALNIQKHGLNFDTAVLVFEDEDYIEWYDAEHSETENRYNVLVWCMTCFLSSTPSGGRTFESYPQD